jgi:hypothetical protein
VPRSARILSMGKLDSQAYEAEGVEGPSALPAAFLCAPTLRSSFPRLMRRASVMSNAGLGPYSSSMAAAHFEDDDEDE